ncbi:MAG: 2-C-methyl-D-erythritol 2,4-cyclodiphosphate synthase [Candidatus Zixiibacteriota bacterium]|nr:MAG: 2-C-methyl-D-erythritol 2,4-cyclodiphosphate synthase [candidate division Zixibacteria bacterium]
MKRLRIGHGFDVHRLVEGRRLVIGGVEIPHDRGLLGHSDADVLLHAIADALLGGAGLGDIGHHFPPDDGRFKDADSSELLAEVARFVREAGFSTIVNVDAIVMAERPKLAPHISAMKENIGRVLHIKVGSVGVKATTTEKLGLVGREEGIAASAVCLIVSDE